MIVDTTPEKNHKGTNERSHEISGKYVQNYWKLDEANDSEGQ